MNKTYFVYILTNKHHTVFYTGVTNNLGRRIYEHREKLIEGFTEKYSVSKLLYYEEFEDINYAIEAEKRIKKYKRAWKWNLINSINPKHQDLYELIFG